MAERQFSSGYIGPDTRFKLLVDGRMGAAEFDALIEKLRFDKNLLAETAPFVVDPIAATPIVDTSEPEIAGAVSVGVGRAPPRPDPTIGGVKVTGFPQELLHALPLLMTKFPNGPTIKEASIFMGADAITVRKALNGLNAAGLVRLERRSAKAALHVVPPDFDKPVLYLTDKQQLVLKALRDAAKGEVAVISITGIAKIAGFKNTGSVVSIVDALEHKGYVEILKRGGPSHPTRYRLLNAASAGVVK